MRIATDILNKHGFDYVSEFIVGWREMHHIIDLLFEVNRSRGTTLVLQTPDRELAARADQRVVLRDGRIVERQASVSGGSPAAPRDRV